MTSIFKPKGSIITVKEFRNVMTNLGEKLTDDELNELFKELKMEKEDSFNF
jgi:Ca2+-binding EF-hand superfamily protein